MRLSKTSRLKPCHLTMTTDHDPSYNPHHEQQCRHNNPASLHTKHLPPSDRSVKIKLPLAPVAEGATDQASRDASSGMYLGVLGPSQHTETGRDPALRSATRPEGVRLSLQRSAGP